MKAYKFLYITLIVSILIHLAVFLYLYLMKDKDKKEKEDYTVVEYLPKEEPPKAVDNPKPKEKQQPEIDNRVIPPEDDNRETTLEHDRLTSAEKPKTVLPRPNFMPQQNQQKNDYSAESNDAEKKKEEVISSIDREAILNTKEITERIANQFIRPEEKEGEDTASYNRFQERYASYFGKFRTRVYQVWRYPTESIARGERGVVQVTFSILKDGSIVNIRMIKSSGYPALDREVMRVLKSMGKVPLPSSYKLNQLNIDEAYFFYDSDESINRWIR